MGQSLSTFKIAHLLHVNPSSVANWVDQGLLLAHRTPGGHRRFRESEVRSMLAQLTSEATLPARP